MTTTTGTVKAKFNLQINPPLVTKTLFDPTFGCITPYGKEMKDHHAFKDQKEEDALKLPHHNLVLLFFLKYWLKIRGYFYIRKINKNRQQKKIEKNTIE